MLTSPHRHHSFPLSTCTPHFQCAPRERVREIQQEWELQQCENCDVHPRSRPGKEDERLFLVMLSICYMCLPTAHHSCASTAAHHSCAYLLHTILVNVLHVPTFCTPFSSMCYTCLPTAHHSRQCATRAYLLHTILVNVLHVPPYCTPFSSMCYTCLPTALTLPPTAHHFTLQKGGSA